MEDSPAILNERSTENHRVSRGWRTVSACAAVLFATVAIAPQTQTAREYMPSQVATLSDALGQTVTSVVFGSLEPIKPMITDEQK